MLCQETFNNLDQSHARIAACASCCERLLSADGKQGIVEMKIDDSPQIRTVVATLYDKVDLDKPTVEFLCEHFYKDPTLALVYVWQYSMTNYSQMLIDQSYGIAFQT